MNAEHFAILKSGPEEWNRWREANTGIMPDLSEADLGDSDLSGANLKNAVFHLANLSGVNLFDADLSKAKLNGANLSSAILHNAKLNSAQLLSARLVGAKLGGANLHNARLIDAILSSAYVRGANLKDADLSGAKLNGARLEDANFSGAALDGASLANAFLRSTTFTDTDLSLVTGLESVRHGGPSYIGIETIYKSNGVIPEVFLRGCGAPDSFICQVRALIGAEEGIQFYSCFISYSGKDEEFAKRLHGRLQQEHVRVWFAPEDIQGGKKLHEQIEEAIRIFDKLLIVLSENSLQSEWVMTELRKARKQERKTGKRKLFPVRLVNFKTLQEWECFDADGGQDLAIEVREYFIPDFSDWKNHDSFEAAFARLLADLRAQQSAK